MKVVFLDRDGVINEYPGDGNYVTKIKDCHLVPGSREAISRLTDHGYKIFVVSNQAGVDKGIYSQHKLDAITRYITKSLAKTRGRISKFFYCTHRSDAGCDCRKPAIGSVKRALKLLGQPLSAAQKTFFVGDTRSDIEAGHNAGCKTIFVLSGRERRRHIRSWPVKPDFVCNNLLEAAGVIEKHENSNHSRLSRRRSHQSR